MIEVGFAVKATAPVRPGTGAAGAVAKARARATSLATTASFPITPSTRGLPPGFV